MTQNPLDYLKMIQNTPEIWKREKWKTQKGVLTVNVDIAVD